MLLNLQPLYCPLGNEKRLYETDMVKQSSYMLAIFLLAYFWAVVNEFKGYVTVTNYYCKLSTDLE